MALGFAFEGCSCRSAFQVGAMEWFDEHGVKVDAVTGASSGSLVATAVAAGRTQSLRPAWHGLIGTRIFRPRRLLRGRWPFAMSHILRDSLDEWLGPLRLPELEIPIGIAVTTIGLAGRRRRILTREDDLPVSRAIRASSFIPGIYSRMVPVDWRPTIDGAWQQRAPVAELTGMGCTRVVALLSDHRGVLRGGVFRPRTYPIPPYVKVLHPTEPLPILGFDFDREATLATFALGRKAAATFARENAAWLAG